MTMDDLIDRRKQISRTNEVLRNLNGAEANLLHSDLIHLLTEAKAAYYRGNEHGRARNERWEVGGNE